MIIEGISNWNRKLLNVYWVIVFLSIVIELINSFLTVDDFMFFIYNSVLFPTIISTLSLIIVEIVIRLFKSFQDYIVITMGTILSGIQIDFHYGMPVLYSALFLSLMVAISYYNKAKIYYSSLLNILCFLFLYRFNAYIYESTSLVELVTFITIMVIASFISNAIMVQGINLSIERNVLESEAKHDSLTGLYNRRSFDKHYNRIMSLKQNSYVAFLDIDNFKLINDTYGHLIGDNVIKRISAVMKEVVNPTDHCYRYGGEEFAILFTNQSEEEVFDKLNRILYTTATLQISEIQGKKITVSIGLSKIKSDGNTLAEADESLYEAKKSGKNKIIYRNKEKNIS